MLNCCPCFCDGWKFINITLHSICGSLLVALSLTDDVRLSTLLKFSTHIFKIASLAVRSVLPSALQPSLIQSYYHLDVPCASSVFLLEAT